MDYDATLSPKKFQTTPKKLMLSKDFPISKTYRVRATVWIPNNPVQKNQPMVVLTLSHGAGSKRQYVRLAFENYQELTKMVLDIGNWLLNDENMDVIPKKLNEAIQEWKDTWAKINKKTQKDEEKT